MCLTLTTLLSTTGPWSKVVCGHMVVHMRVLSILVKILTSIVSSIPAAYHKLFDWIGHGKVNFNSPFVFEQGFCGIA